MVRVYFRGAAHLTSALLPSARFPKRSCVRFQANGHRLHRDLGVCGVPPTLTIMQKWGRGFLQCSRVLPVLTALLKAPKCSSSWVPCRSNNTPPLLAFAAPFSTPCPESAFQAPLARYLLYCHNFHITASLIHGPHLFSDQNIRSCPVDYQLCSRM